MNGFGKQTDGKSATARVVVSLVVFMSLWAAPQVGAGADDAVNVYYFRGDGCPVCDRQSDFLDDLEEEYPGVEVHRFEVWYDEDNRALLQQVADRFGFEPRGVPVTVIGRRHWVGFHAGAAAAMRRAVEECGEHGCPDPAGELVPAVERSGPAEAGEALGLTDALGLTEALGVTEALERAEALGSADGSLELPLIGEIAPADYAPVVVTGIIALVDGFNPCSLWVLTMLLALVVYTRSRMRTVLVGTTFLLVTAAVYGAFIAGAFAAFALVPQMGVIRAVTAALAAVFGILSVREYFRQGSAAGVTLSARQKRGIGARLHSILRGDRSTAGMLALTAVAAAGIALVELPCTAGFPVIWSGVMSARGIAGTEFLVLLALYLALYLLIEIAVFFTAVFGLRVGRASEGYARVVKLFGGMIMLTLAAALAFVPDAVTDVERTLALIGAALAAGIAVIIVTRRLEQRRL